LPTFSTPIITSFNGVFLGRCDVSGNGGPGATAGDGGPNGGAPIGGAVSVVTSAVLTVVIVRESDNSKCCCDFDASLLAL
jgi:hypothetical protein